MSWLIGRYDGTKDWAPDREAELIELVKRHGLDPAHIMPRLVITVDAGGQHRMHLSRFVSGPEGKGRVIDIARDQVVSEPVVIDVEPDSWPSWLTALNTFDRASHKKPGEALP